MLDASASAETAEIVQAARRWLDRSSIGTMGDPLKVYRERRVHQCARPSPCRDIAKCFEWGSSSSARLRE